MSWDVSTPDPLPQIRTQLVACAAAVSAGLVEANVHWPDSDPDDTFPLAILDIQDQSVDPAFTDVFLTSGTVTISNFSDGTPGSVRALAHNIAKQICTDTGQEGLRVVSVSSVETEGPPENQEAGDQIWFCTITLDYGLEA